MNQLIREANRLASAGLTEQAENLLKNALILNQTNEELLKALLLLLIQSSKYDEAATLTKTLKELSNEESQQEVVAKALDPIPSQLRPQHLQIQDELDIDFDYAEKLEHDQLGTKSEEEPNELGENHESSPTPSTQDDSPADRGIDVNGLADSVAEFYDEAQDAEEQEEDYSALLAKEAQRQRHLEELRVAQDDDYQLDEEYALEITEELRSREELSALPNKETREGRALQVASELCFEFDLDDDFADLLTEIFLHYGWSSTQRKLRDLLEDDLEVRELALAFEIRQIWARNVEFHESVTYDGRAQRYIALPWKTAVEFVRAYHAYPQIEEVEGYLEDAYVEWDRRETLRRRFNSFYLLIADIIENCDGLEPPAITDYMR